MPIPVRLRLNLVYRYPILRFTISGRAMLLSMARLGIAETGGCAHQVGAIVGRGILNGGNRPMIPRRIVLNDIGDLFIGGMMSGPPIVVQGEAETPMATLVDVGMFYDYSLGGTLSGSNWDSVTGGYLALIRVNPTTATGYYLTSDTAGLVPYMPILTEMIEPVDSASNYHPSTAILNPQTVLGYVTRVGGDTVFLSNMGQGIHDSTVCSIFPARLKKQ